MSEEEIINECKRIIFEYGSIRQDTKGEKEDLQALEGLLDLYNKEKQENEYLNIIIESDNDNYINKDKIREKIEKLEKDYKEINQYGDFIIADTIQPRIEILKELLEE